MTKNINSYIAVKELSKILNLSYETFYCIYLKHYTLSKYVNQIAYSKHKQPVFRISSESIKALKSYLYKKAAGRFTNRKPRLNYNSIAAALDNFLK